MRREYVTLPLLALIAGSAVALGFCFAVHPQLEAPYNAVLDPDGYGQLGINLWKGQGFSFVSKDGPTVYRGPLYPAFVALLLFVSAGWYPQAVWCAQSVLHGLTCGLVYLLAYRVWGRRTARLAAFGCVFYPVLFWYAPRLWNETLIAFLLIGLSYLLTVSIDRDSRVVAALVGAVLGLLCLTKATFVPWILLLPASTVCLQRGARVRFLLISIASAMLLVAPWTVRNYLIVHKVVLVHVGGGFNLKLGNEFADRFWNHPLSYDAIWRESLGFVDTIGHSPLFEGPKEVQDDEVYLSSAIDDLVSHPSLILKKIIVAGMMFWYIGENATKTILLLVMRLPVLVLGFYGMWQSIRERRTTAWPAIIIVSLYWVSHLPFAPPVRLSMPIMPLIFIFAASGSQRPTASVRRATAPCG